MTSSPEDNEQRATAEALLAAAANEWSNPRRQDVGIGGCTAPKVSILSMRADHAVTQVRAVMHFSAWEYPLSGSGWSDYYYRMVVLTLSEPPSLAVIGEEVIHCTEYQDETFDSQAALAAFVARH